MEEQYRDHGISVTHRRRPDGNGYVPELVSKRDFDRCLKARGMVDMD